MLLYQEPKISSVMECPYIPDRKLSFEYFFACDVNEEELDILLEDGWRKFGRYFFRPSCGKCKSCIPIRICVDSFHPSKSKRRIARKNLDLKIVFDKITESPEIYEIFKKHSLYRFGKEADWDEYVQNFCIQSCPSLQSLYLLNGKIIAAGFIDRSKYALSSVYFIYDCKLSSRGLGIYSILKEINYAAELGMRYYYLGYYVEGNGRMAYKAGFFPHERYDWNSRKWYRIEQNQE